MRVKSSERVRAQWPCWRTVVATRFRLHAIFPITAILLSSNAYFSDGSRGTWRVRAAALSARTVGATLKTERTTRGWRTSVAGGSRCGDNEWALSQSRATRLPLLASTVFPTFPLIHPFANSPTLLPWRSTIGNARWYYIKSHYRHLYCASISTIIYDIKLFIYFKLNSFPAYYSCTFRENYEKKQRWPLCVDLMWWT